MNSFVVCVFVFILGLLAVKVPAEVDRSEGPGRNPRLLEKRSSELLNAFQESSLITRRTVGKHNSDRWRKMNFAPVCFGAKNQEFGRFSVHYVSGGKLSAVKLVHLYGYVTCDSRHVSYWSYWGCGDYYSGDKIAVVITTATNHVLLPQSQFIVAQGAKWSKVPGYTSVSPELELSFFNPYSVQSGQKLRLWYGEDLMNVSEGDNGGRACVDIYAIYI
ncbi:uncharacterized protein [Montipora foliosa]|uniref:uncharacterized protein n=1 Tax=Montipora foliosa TaxID=591990 RepID=UPI0035F1E805